MRHNEKKKNNKEREKKTSTSTDMPQRFIKKPLFCPSLTTHLTQPLPHLPRLIFFAP